MKKEDTESKLKKEFQEKYKDNSLIEKIEESNLYSNNVQLDIDDSQDEKEMTEDIRNIEKYIDYKKEKHKHLSDVEIIVNDKQTNDKWLKDYFHLKDNWKQDTLRVIFEKAYNDLSEEASKSNDEILRKVIIFQDPYNTYQDPEHITCFVLFYDKTNKTNPISLITSNDNDLKSTMWHCVDKKEHNFWKLNSATFLNIQRDPQSCGVVATEMAKHLTIDWYKKEKDKEKYKKTPNIELLKEYKDNQLKIMYLQNNMLHRWTTNGLPKEQYDDKENTLKSLDKEIEKIEQQYLILPYELLPKKLLAYKQGDLYKLENEYKDIFDKNLNRGDIKNVKSEKYPDGHIQNIRLQNRKKRIKFIGEIQNTIEQLERIHKITKANKSVAQNKQAKIEPTETNNDEVLAYQEYLEHKQIAKERDKARKLQGLDELKEDKIQTDFV